MTGAPTESTKRQPTADTLNAMAAATSAVAKNIVETAESAGTAERRKAERRRRERIAAGVLVAGALVAWLAFPPSPGDLDPRTPERVTMDLRMTVAAAAQQVEDYRLAKGTLPGSLGEAGGDWGSVNYTRAGETYQVTGTEGSQVITYASSQSLPDFARNIVAAGVKP